MLMFKELPRYECLLAASREFPDLDPSAAEAVLYLLRARDEAFRIIEAHLAQHDITQGRFGVLVALWSNCAADGRAAPLTPAEIADRTGVTRATITGLIDTLERAGYVTRTPHPEDRRMSCVELTPLGDALLTRVMPEHFRQIAWLMEPLSEAERKSFVRLLRKVILRAGEEPVCESSRPADAAPA